MQLKFIYDIIKLGGAKVCVMKDLDIRVCRIRHNRYIAYYMGYAITSDEYTAYSWKDALIEAIRNEHIYKRRFYEEMHAKKKITKNTCKSF